MAIRINPQTGLLIFDTRAATATDKIAGSGYSLQEDESLKTLPPQLAGAVFNAEEQARYRAFKEVRRGAADYMAMEGEFAKYLEDVYSEPPVPRDALTDECEILVVGAGFAGLLLWHKLSRAAFQDVRFCEKGGDVGGTWYWNRYPGIACDVESYSYLPLLEEMEYVPIMKFASGFEILEYCQKMAEKFGFYDHCLFHTTVETTQWDVVANGDLDVAHDVMFASVTDHVFIDGGHTLDFTNKAFEALGHVGETEAQRVLGTLVAQTAGATRSEEQSSWRHPHDLAGLVADAAEKLPLLWDEAEARRGSFEDVADLAHQLLVDDPEAIVGAVTDAISLGATGEQLGRAVALAAGLRITRFHVQNDHSDWNTVHHGFTTANGLHAALARQTTPELLRGVLHGALRVYQDRFLNIPAARLPDTTESLAELDDCFEAQGEVDRAGAIVHHHLVDGGDVGVVIRRLGRALLDEDAGFHWYQTVEAGVRQALAWPNGSEEQALLLAGLARFLAAHTPTRREIPNIIDIAARLRRGATLYEGEDEAG